MKALVSVSDKAGIVNFCSELVKLGYEIVSTGGTFKVLIENGVKAIPVEDITEFPEMLDNRVKTLHPKIHGGLLSLRENEEHMATCKEHGIPLIDMVVVNLYPFEKTINSKDVTLETAIANIDIGGPSMIRSAAKNYQSVGVVVNPERYDTIIAELKNSDSKLSKETKESLACEAFSHTARYDGIISSYLEKTLMSKKGLPDFLSPNLQKISDLRYGENPHQDAAFYKLTDTKGLPKLKQHQGKELSYNNIVDIEAAWKIVKSFDLPCASVIKHTNPCGAAIGEDITEAYTKAFECDPKSAFGSIVGLNRSVTKKTAEELAKTFIEVIVAPSFDDEALSLLSKKSSLRLISLDDFFNNDPSFEMKNIDGGCLVQTTDTFKVDMNNLNAVTDKKPTAKELIDLAFVFTLVKYVKSNAIVIVNDGRAVGVGAGQMSRVDAMEIALSKAGDLAKGAVVGSDAFFPFSDSLELAAKHGVKAVIQPGGSKRDQESIDCCNENDMTMVFTGIRHFKH
ncbi:bifunctional phosphoribosylaminoimidazolecarboxamide formyltransferase/IMP cyclohydrolase [bacterium]|jgi:phosphoribosylaminoimidazolecarboxamide formyltransferase / IMP cyclohydrolase|nr:bifunctional phosphoribosylaminoimidazolecarboxamide formyltransferase/IMP cyclohydrolase [bacterium]